MSRLDEIKERIVVDRIIATKMVQWTEITEAHKQKLTDAEWMHNQIVSDRSELVHAYRLLAACNQQLAELGFITDHRFVPGVALGEWGCDYSTQDGLKCCESADDHVYRFGYLFGLDPLPSPRPGIDLSDEDESELFE